MDSGRHMGGADKLGVSCNLSQFLEMNLQYGNDTDQEVETLFHSGSHAGIYIEDGQDMTGCQHFPMITVYREKTKKSFF